MVFFSSRRRHTRYWRDWSSDVCSSDLGTGKTALAAHLAERLDRPLAVKRASDLLSEWVGGTEANIAEAFAEARDDGRSEERRVGKGGRFRWAPYDYKKNHMTIKKEHHD